ncbi:hypothetical protein PUNSTDRAFT_58362 [Punctularia strigosozonata HHB-11173 SS5]|uniref:uncharacterized protein n=1 Tax=Punctularia strigosozonata (strain HHB-11173) TaxID=741275 RepID=UPI0004417431|nr:uncharacterized protein PUNSTDRAFT_58362 [Punctularia strigosozonata HHB-11173 SS5]EIN14697.1 hypothetical protein PUNSTDRAFT_58362 [Punctularia strigosozonata HHB-11173 SS5]
MPEVRLPRTLARPQFTPVSPAAIAALDPDLAGTPIEYIRKGLQAQASQMLASCSQLPALPPTIPSSRLPPSLSIPVAPSASSPTHLLAVSTIGTKSTAVTTVPTHHLVLAANCAHLPAFPRAAAPSSRTQLTLPVTPMAVPAAEAFPTLHRYLYTKSVPQLLTALTNLQITSSVLNAGTSSRQVPGSTRAQLSHALAQSAGYDAQRLMNLAQRVNGFWRNACALGVFDTEMWDAMDLAWDVILGALNIVLKGRQ